MRARVPVFEIMTATPLTIGVDASVAEAAGLMRANDVGSLIVIEDGRPSGIVTERDVVTKVAAEERAPRRDPPRRGGPRGRQAHVEPEDPAPRGREGGGPRRHPHGERHPEDLAVPRRRHAGV